MNRRPWIRRVRSTKRWRVTRPWTLYGWRFEVCGGSRHRLSARDYRVSPGPATRITRERAAKAPSSQPNGPGPQHSLSRDAVSSPYGHIPGVSESPLPELPII